MFSHSLLGAVEDVKKSFIGCYVCAFESHNDIKKMSFMHQKLFLNVHEWQVISEFAFKTGLFLVISLVVFHPNPLQACCEI